MYPYFRSTAIFSIHDPYIYTTLHALPFAFYPILSYQHYLYPQLFLSYFQPLVFLSLLAYLFRHHTILYYDIWFETSDIFK
ncbi:hypothetical protein FA15DRAFT_508061 [Coprinopsis marcescibilis]|uniref:Uncharacterized protein n=1 Tax=Coprinopsis marcescibilis TaxID=230819 RepID=A0A5C3L855_COPMA|nr:hypothetical protein FA15DRAFT_508061 [Coprinopsis marcescibilis]